MRQIEMMISFIAHAVFKNKDLENDITENFVLNPLDELYLKIEDMLSKGDICGAEDFLFDSVDTNNLQHLKTALYFYNKLNRLSDEELKQHNFSKSEISDGLKDIADMFGVNIPLIL